LFAAGEQVFFTTEVAEGLLKISGCNFEPNMVFSAVLSVLCGKKI
jgi:hypothetical protein